MDVVSGIGTVIQLFQSCLKLYGDIRSVIERDADVRANSALLAAEQYKLGKLSEFLSQPSQPGILPICHLFLKPIEDDLKSVQALIVRHGKPLSPVTTGLDEDGIQNVAQKTKFRPIQIVSSIRRTGHSITWMAADKERLTELVGRLHQLIDGLSMLVTDSQRQRIEYQAMSTSIATNNVFELEELQYAALPQFPTIAQGAAVKALTLTARGRLPRELDGQDTVLFSKIAFESFLWRSIAQKNLPYATDSPVYRANVEKLTLEEKAMAALDHSATQVHTRSTNGDRLQVLVEWRASFRSEESPGDFAYRLNYLVNILRQMSRRISTEDDTYERSINFGVLECIGWTTSSPNFDRIGLVFRCPANLSQTPDSLHDWIRERKKESVDLPSLGTRFDIAYGLATALFNLVSVGWTHKELRSHNVLFFDRTLPTPKLYLSGFTYARPVASLKDDLSFLNPDPVYELYRPPQNLMRQYHLGEIVQTSAYLHPRDPTSDATSSIKWTSAKDIYGLGIVLLEIGHWRTIASLKGKSSMSEFLENVLPKAVNDLSYRVGDIYRDVVSTCLHLGSWVDNDDEMREQLAEMMQKLAQCRA